MSVEDAEDPYPSDPIKAARSGQIEACDGGRLRAPEVETKVLEEIHSWWDRNPEDLQPDSGRDSYRALLHHEIDTQMHGYLSQHDIQPGSLTWKWYVECAAAQRPVREHTE